MFSKLSLLSKMQKGRGKDELFFNSAQRLRRDHVTVQEKMLSELSWT